jgi:isochorismate pyruvate lyase
MAELREAIDSLDRALVGMLAQRAAYIERAIEIKQAEGIPARVEERVAEVLGKVRAEATAQGLSPELAEAVWRVMVEHFIAREEDVLEGRRT